MKRILAIAAVVGALWVGHAYPHDHNRPDLNPWFEGLHSKAKESCCDGSDAMRLDDVDWDYHDGHYWVRMEGEWVQVPDDAVIEEPNRAGSAMVWPYRSEGKLNKVRCFLKGSES